jgi:hypothetical protein
MNRKQRRATENSATRELRTALAKARREAAEAMKVAEKMKAAVEAERTDENVERLKEATTIAMARAIVVQRLERGLPR